MASARSGATTATMPMPQLKVRSISGPETPAVLAQPAEDRRQVPGVEIDHGTEPFGQHPRQVLGQPAAGDVRERVHAARADRGERGADIDACRLQQRRTERAGAERAGRVPAEARIRHDPPHKAEAVGMHARGGEAEQNVTRRHARGQPRAALHRADREAREVEVARRVEAGHLCGLAADQRAARLSAALGDALDDRGRSRHIELAGREIIEEEQRLRPLADQVVHAHRDEIDPDRAEAAGVDRELELGADPVRRRHEDRIAVAGCAQVEKRAEPAEALILHPWAHWRIPMDMIFHGRSTRLFHASQQSATMSS
jgi:hypothetical protein